MKKAFLLLLAMCPLAAAGVILVVPSTSLTGLWRQPQAQVAGNPNSVTSSGNAGQTPPSVAPQAQTPQPAVATSVSRSQPPVSAAATIPASGQVSIASSSTNTSTGTAPTTTTNVPPTVSATSSASGGYSKEARQLALLTGRRIVTKNEADQSSGPLKYVGWITNENAPDVAVGSGTLIGSRCVLTAAHVLETVIHRADSLGAPIFMLPNGQFGRIVDEELDGGWKKKIMSFDLGVCQLDNKFDSFYRSFPLFEGVQFDDDPNFGNSIHCSGFDLDLWLASNTSGNLPCVVDRSGTLSPMKIYAAKSLDKLRQYMEFKDAIPDFGVGFSGSQSVSLTRKRKQIESTLSLERSISGEASAGWVFAGIGIVAAEYYAMQGRVYDKYGWSSECIGSSGVNGGPIWVEDLKGDGNRGGCQIIGVVGIPFGDAEVSSGVSIGRLAGSRITQGAGYRMIHDFCASHP